MVSGIDVFVVGVGVIVSVICSSVLGIVVVVLVIGVIVIGVDVFVCGINSMVIGCQVFINVINGVVIGNGVFVSNGVNSIVIGFVVGVFGVNVVVLGVGLCVVEVNVVLVGGGNGIDGLVMCWIVNVGVGCIVEGSIDVVIGGQFNIINQCVGVVEICVGDIDICIGLVENVVVNVFIYDDSSCDMLILFGLQGIMLENVGNGLIVFGSCQVINGGQLFQLLSDVVSFFGGGVSVGMQGVFVVFNYVIQGVSYVNVGDVLGVFDCKVIEFDQCMVGSGGMVWVCGVGVMVVSVGLVIVEMVVLLFSDMVLVDVQGMLIVVSVGGSQVYVVLFVVVLFVVNVVVMGEGVVVSGVVFIVIGQGVLVIVVNLVVLGQGLVVDCVDMVLVGVIGNECQVIYVVVGIQVIDVVNKGQFDGGIVSVNSYIDQCFIMMVDSFDIYKGEIDQCFCYQDCCIDCQGVMSVVMFNMVISVVGVCMQNCVGVGIGFQGGELVLLLGYQCVISECVMVILGGVFSSDDSLVGVGVGFGW